MSVCGYFCQGVVADDLLWFYRGLLFLAFLLFLKSLWWFNWLESCVVFLFELEYLQGIMDTFWLSFEYLLGCLFVFYYD